MDRFLCLGMVYLGHSGQRPHIPQAMAFRPSMAGNTYVSPFKVHGYRTVLLTPLLVLRLSSAHRTTSS